MKFIIPILMIINVSCFAQDSLPIYSHHYLIEKEISSCKGAKDQLKCIDSLIDVNLNATIYSNKSDPQKEYLNRQRKLGIYNFYGGNIAGLRGDLEQSFFYFEKMEHYFDTLIQNWKANEIKDYQGVAKANQAEFCRRVYFKDTALFNKCNCMRFFPKYEDEIVVNDTASRAKENQKPIVKYPNWGEFYLNDTLRINKHFVSDSASIAYFKQILKPLIQSKLLGNPVYFEMLGDPNMNIKRDTIIYKLTAKYEKGKYERKCEAVFTTSKNPEIFDLILFVLGNIELPGHVRSIEIYIPIVVTTENSNNTNNVNIHDDHFLIEVIKLKPIKQH
ncbi:MAG: hypothetical protein UR43_C0029G0002 [candidate division TM6 bacterium GW2011_GWF2_33_332]|nr:MAG: hypothetical protein UR43_C0029G0002 [candidate division TM6 bacterium GW2011_GWF2_33_332]